MGMGMDVGKAEQKPEGGTVLVLGTGGTIAGWAPGDDDRTYRAAQLAVDDLVRAVPALAGERLETVQVAQVDSKDMGWPVWCRLLEALVQAFARPAIAGVVITHGTDTLEETACLLHWLLPAGKPVVLTAAMRPANSPHADGPANLADAVRVVRSASRKGLQGVVAVMHGRVWAGRDVRKAHAFHIDAFDGGGQAPLANMAWPQGTAALELAWPRPLGWMTPQLLRLPALPPVDIVVSHADADGRMIDALLDAAPRAGTGRPAGLVVAGTGSGTVHQGLEGALERAARQGVVVWRSSRVPQGGVAPRDGERWPAAGPFTPAQARLGLALMLALGKAPRPCQLMAPA